MKNRAEEYQALVSELARPPKRLEASVERARKHARRSRLLRHFTAPIGAAASVAACFVLMVNCFPTFALACSEVPIIRELAAAAFSPSLSAVGAEGSQSYLTYYFQSFYYDPPKGLTLCIDKAEWLDKDAPRTAVELTSGKASGLPAGVEVGDIRRVGGGVELEIWSPSLRKSFAPSFTHTYWDPEGGEHKWHQVSITGGFDNEEGKIKEVFYLDNYSWDTVELELSYTSVSEYDEPVRVPLA